MSIKVCHSSQYYWPLIGGAESYCQNISEGLASSHFKVNVYTTNVVRINPITYSHLKKESHNGVEITRFETLPIINNIYGNKQSTFASASPLLRISIESDRERTWPYALCFRALSSSVPFCFPELVSRISDSDIEVLFNIISGMTSLSYLAARVARRPIITFPMFHVGLTSYERPSLYRILRGSNAIICSSSFERQELIKRGVETSKAFVVYEGIEPPSLDHKSVDGLRNQLELREGENLLVGYIGRRDYDKGYPHVLSAVALLVRQGYRIKLLISGYGERGTQMRDYQYLLKCNALIDFGVVDDKTKLAMISCSDIIVLPSRAETYPLVFVESWFLGRPVIGANIGSVASVVREGIDGFLVEFGDVEALASSIKGFLEDKGRTAHEMGELARVRAEELFDIKNSLSQIQEIYESVTKKC